MKKSLILFALAVMCCTMAFAANGTKIGNIYYILDDANLTATVTWGGEFSYIGTSEYTGSIVIPGSVSYNSEVYQVTSIGEDAFSGCHGLTSVTIPESVTSIGASAFFGDHNLVSANIPLGVTRIENDTFRGCIRLASIVIPGGVTYIGDGAFLNCWGMTDMYVFAMIPPSVHESAFNGMEKDTTRLYVPDVVAYKQADGWKDFTNMTTLDLTFRANAIAAIDAAIEGVTDAAILAIATQAKTEIGQTLTEEQANAIKDKALADIALLQAKANAIAAIDAAIVGVTDETILAIATQAKTDINAATTVEDVVAIKTLPLAKINAFVLIQTARQGIQNAEINSMIDGQVAAIANATTMEEVTDSNLKAMSIISIFHNGIEEGDAAGYARGKAEGIEEGKAEALGEMGEPCTDCPAVEISDNNTTIKLYNPKKVEFMKNQSEE